MNRRIGFGVAPLVVLALSVTACNHGGSSEDTDGAKAKAKAVASSTANTQAEKLVQAKVKGCVDVSTVKLVRKAGRQEVIDCLKGLVPPEKQEQFKSCLAQTAADDKVWTKAGRDAFMKIGVAGCVTKATASATPTPTPSAKGHKKHSHAK